MNQSQFLNNNLTLCSPCFIGKNCEIELSRNLWIYGKVPDILTEHKIPIDLIIMIIFGFFLIFNGILCLQTYLCRKIRETNLGIYLIMLSSVSITIGLFHSLSSLIVLIVKEREEKLEIASAICPCEKYFYIPLVSMYNWFLAAVAIERVLVECFRDYGLHDSRRRSILFSLMILIICPLSALPGAFTVQEHSLSQYKQLFCQNYTKRGYLIYEIITNFHLFSFYFIYILMNVTVLSKLIRRRQRFVENDSLIQQIRLILNNHKDFFIPYLVQALGQLPNLVFEAIMTCQTAGTKWVANIHLLFFILQVLPFTITFYLFICLSPVYLAIFWESSPIGKCLTKIKNKFEFHHKNQTKYSSIPLELYK